MKTRAMYSVRYYVGMSYCRPVGYKMRLVPRSVASKIVKRLRGSGVDAFYSKVNVYVGKPSSEKVK